MPEIERKWKLSGKDTFKILADPRILISSSQIIRQKYLATNNTLGTVRLRQIDSEDSVNYVLGYKSNPDDNSEVLVREEQEVLIPSSLGKAMMSNLDYNSNPLIYKKYTFSLGDKGYPDLEGEIKIYPQMQLVLLEIEFSSLSEASEFDLSKTLGDVITNIVEVTNMSNYQSVNMFRDLNPDTTEV